MRWNTLESNFSTPSEVTIVGTSARDKWFSWEVHLHLEWIRRKVKNETAT